MKKTTIVLLLTGHLCLLGLLGPFQNMTVHAQTQSTQTQSTQMYNGIDLSKLSGPYLGQTPPGSTPRLFAPGIVSTNNQHSSVYFTKDALEAYFSKFDKDDHKIMIVKQVDGIWTKPEKVVRGNSPYLSPDGKKLFFATNRIYYCNRIDDSWSKPVDTGDIINFQKGQDGPSVNSDGDLFYTAMFGENDGLYYSKYLNNKYSPPVKLDISVDGNRFYWYQVPAPDNSYLLFNSWTDKTGFGMQDIYVVFRKNDGTWSKAINLGEKINTKHSESFPFISHDGKYLFFNSNRPSILSKKRGGQFFGNVYWIDASFINDLKPNYLKE